MGTMTRLSGLYNSVDCQVCLYYETDIKLSINWHFIYFPINLHRKMHPDVNLKKTILFPFSWDLILDA